MRRKEAELRRYLPDGSLAWKVGLGFPALTGMEIRHPPAADAEGSCWLVKLDLAAEEARLLRISADGELVHTSKKLNLQVGMVGLLVAGPDGSLYRFDGEKLRVRSPDGKVAWRHEAGR